MMSNNSDKIRIYECGVFVFVAYLLVNSAGCSHEFYVASKHFENVENLIWNILKKKLLVPWLVGFFPENYVKFLE